MVVPFCSMCTLFRTFNDNLLPLFRPTSLATPRVLEAAYQLCEHKAVDLLYSQLEARGIGIDPRLATSKIALRTMSHTLTGFDRI